MKIRGFFFKGLKKKKKKKKKKKRVTVLTASPKTWEEIG